MAVLKTKFFGPAEVTLPHLDDDPDYRSAQAELAALRERAEKTELRRQAAKARMGNKKAKRSVAERARDLVAGGFVAGTDPKTEIQACNEEDAIIFPAMAETQARIDEIAGALSFQANSLLRPGHEESLRGVYDAVVALHAAVQRVLDCQRVLTLAGHRHRSDVLPLTIPPAAWMLGDPNSWNTQAATFKRQLETLKVL